VAARAMELIRGSRLVAFHEPLLSLEHFLCEFLIPLRKEFRLCEICDFFQCEFLLL
jgi:hypothetical protein